ncbi:hypothetical protein F2P81_004084 [Scophthalmus maximus]|uniref:C-type lectin domain-containing protein n=1 Tax=Scophthalmus maximus TaxID=52904 RepID=A0A6A4T8S2_SCOMX|nr:hypothetical protein F2P81_004084 [Scophthalmus maximus]
MKLRVGGSWSGAGRFSLKTTNLRITTAAAWKWSRGRSDYRAWAPGEPSGSGDCVAVSSLNKRMSTRDCSARFPLVCSADNLVLVKENKTWEEALQHCRALGSPRFHGVRHELLSVQPGQEHDYARNRVMEADTEELPPREAALWSLVQERHGPSGDQGLCGEEELPVLQLVVTVALILAAPLSCVCLLCSRDAEDFSPVRWFFRR